jgi:DNA-binding NtrC family response regulator
MMIRQWRRGWKTLFQRRGYQVIVASSERAVTEVVGSPRVDGLRLDFRIPDLRGDVLYAAAIAVQFHLCGRVVFLTGDISEDVSEPLKGERCAVVLKPFDIPELERVAAEAMRDGSRETRSTAPMEEREKPRSVIGPRRTACPNASCWHPHAIACLPY